MKNKDLSPIVLFAYNRPGHLKKAVESLKKNKLAKKSELIVYSDGHKGKEDKDDVQKVRDYLDSLKKGFKKIRIIKRKRSYGLARSVISGVSEVMEEYSKVIVLEDDLVTSPAFLTFMNKMLNKYKDKDKVFSITGYNYPKQLMKIPDDYPYDIYLSPRAGSWSWATWKDRWEQADWEVSGYEKFKNNKVAQNKFNIGGEDMSRMLINQIEGKIDSWAIRWCYTLFKNDGLCVYPVKSYVNNIGLDSSGTHGGKSDKYVVNTMNLVTDTMKTPSLINIDSTIMKEFKSIFKTNFAQKIKLSLKKLICN